MKFLILTLLMSSFAPAVMGQSKQAILGSKLKGSTLAGRRAPGPKVQGQATVLVSASHGGGDSYTLCQNASSGVTYPCNLCGLSVADPSDTYECK